MTTISINTDRVENGFIYTKREINDEGIEQVTVYVREMDGCPSFDSMWRDTTIVPEEEPPLPPLPKTPVKKKLVVANSGMSNSHHDDGEAV